MLLLSVLHPSLEYGSEVWEGNKYQAASLESIMLRAKSVLVCSSKTSNEAVWEDTGALEACSIERPQPCQRFGLAP